MTCREDPQRLVNQAHIPSYVDGGLTLIKNDNKSACLGHLRVLSPIPERLVQTGISILKENYQIILSRLSGPQGHDNDDFSTMLNTLDDSK
jgi:hypothetical protein